jgi:magnesium transporter
MTQLIKKMSKKRGLTPGSMVFVGTKKVEAPHITVVDYDETEYREVEAATVAECLPFRDTPTITWINVTGVHDVAVVEEIGTHFGLHPLIMEDIVNTGERPKIDESEQYIGVVLKMLYLSPGAREKVSEQVSIVFGTNFVISFQEKDTDVFGSLRERLQKTIPRGRFLHADYLAYTLLDAVIDSYFSVLEQFGEDIEILEDVIVLKPSPVYLQKVHDIKRELILMRKRTWPLREVVGAMERSQSPLIHEATRVYVRDLYEHVIQVIDTVETFRDMASGLLDIYLSSASNRLNEVMKVLTIIATIFIPLGFLAGVYGMNFNTSAGPFNMPELTFPYGYVIFWLVCLTAGGGMLWYFKRRGWL